MSPTVKGLCVCVDKWRERDRQRDTEREGERKIFYKELAGMIMEAGKSQVCG